MLEPKFHHRFNFSPVDNAKIIKLLTEIESLKTRFVVQSNLSPQLINRLIQSVIITSSAASTRIEGSLLNDNQVKELFAKIKIQNFKTRDEQEVAGYLELLKIVFESWDKLIFGQSLIKSFHSQLLKYSIKDDRHRGNYKFGSNRIEARDNNGELIGILFDPTPPYLVEKEINELVEYTQLELKKEDFQPLLIIANFVFEYLTIHPFQDGNGRSSRVLTNLMMLQSGYTFTPFVSHEKIVEQNKQAYYQALISCQKTWKKENEDISSWVLFFLEMVKIQGVEAVKILENKEDMELVLTENQLKVWNVIIESQINLSRSQIQKNINIPLSTVRQTLQKLVNLEKIEMTGSGAGTRYRVKK
jgi:Fic family protein